MLCSTVFILWKSPKYQNQHDKTVLFSFLSQIHLVIPPPTADVSSPVNGLCKDTTRYVSNKSLTAKKFHNVFLTGIFIGTNRKPYECKVLFSFNQPCSAVQRHPQNHSIISDLSYFQSSLKKKIKTKKITGQPTSSSTKVGNRAFILATGNDFFVASGDPRNTMK